MTFPFRKSGLWVIAVLLSATAVALARWYPDTDASIVSELNRQSPAGGRLFRASSPPQDDKVSEDALARAQVYALSLTDTPGRIKIQSLIEMALGHWPKAVEVLAQLREERHGDAELLNNLGVATMALGAEHGVNYFNALSLFEEARKADPASPAPLYNALRVYRIVGLTQLIPEARAEYERIESNRQWLAELDVTPTRNDSQLVNRMRQAVESGNLDQAAQLFAANLEFYRRVVTEYAMNPADAGTDSAAQYIAEKLRTDYQDATITAMLAPLRGAARDRVLKARGLVSAGSDAYLKGDLGRSDQFYEQAEDALRGVDSDFDRMWIDLNRSDTGIRRNQDLDKARQLLERIVTESSSRNYQWVRGQALAAIGSNMAFKKDYEGLQSTLHESADILTHIGASQYASRPLYYIALWQFIAGDAEGALETALRSHQVSRPDDHIRLTQLYWLMGMTLYRANDAAHAVAFLKEATEQATASGNSILLAASTSDLASIHMSMLNYAEARRLLSQATDLSKDLDPRARDTLDYALNLLCGRSQLANGNPWEASICLERNMDKLKELPQPLHWFAIPTMQLLAQAQTALGKASEARELYERAATAADNDDSYLTTEKPRLGFDNVRRDLYESAIAFEYDNNDDSGSGAEDEAWRYVQRYRSKLFLEFLGQVNPAVARIHSDAVQTDKVQKLLGSNVQVVEYFMLKDRLLIWLVSQDRIRAFPIAVKRESLDRKITELVARIRKQEDVEERLEEFYALLIAPISPFLDAHRALAIIPDQALHRLPIAALRASASSKYLGEQYAILESPNLTTLLAATSGAPERNFAVAFGSQAVDLAADKDISLFSRIYKSVRGVNGPSATRDNFFSFMGTASVFHYAGHSVDAPDPLRSAILLDGNGPNSTNRINALEISRRRMRPDALVILASCDSSVGNTRDGIGIRGLTSAFLIAGAGAVAGSLWPVDDDSSSSLMREFHQEFAANISVAEAMRLAQVSFIARNPKRAHPYYWSGFVVNGNLSALR